MSSWKKQSFEQKKDGEYWLLFILMNVMIHYFTIISKKLQAFILIIEEGGWEILTVSMSQLLPGLDAERWNVPPYGHIVEELDFVYPGKRATKRLTWNKRGHGLIE